MRILVFWGLAGTIAVSGSQSSLEVCC